MRPNSDVVFEMTDTRCMTIFEDSLLECSTEERVKSSIKGKVTLKGSIPSKEIGRAKHHFESEVSTNRE